MHQVAVICIGDLPVNISVRIPLTQKIIGHRELSSEKQHPRNPALARLITHRIGDVHHGNINLALDGVIDFMHGIGRDADGLTTRRLQALGFLRQKFARTVPITRALPHRHLGKIHTVDDDRRTVQTATSVSHHVIQVLIINCGRFPTHPAQNADCAHTSCLI